MDAAWQVTLADMMVGTEPHAIAADDFEQLVHDHARLVFRVVYSVLRNRDDAEDAVQETFLRALRHRRKLAGIVDPAAWLARIAWRVAIDRRPKSPPVSEEELQHRAAALESPEAAADEQYAQAQMAAILDALLPALPKELRDTLTLSTVEELTSAEIAEVLSIPEGTVRTRLMRARQMLRDKVSTLLEGKR